MALRRLVIYKSRSVISPVAMAFNLSAIEDKYDLSPFPSLVEVYYESG